MRVFVEKDIEGVGRVSVVGDERIVEFEMTLRKKGERRKQRGIQSSGRRTVGWSDKGRGG